MTILNIWQKEQHIHSFVWQKKHRNDVEIDCQTIYIMAILVRYDTNAKEIKYLHNMVFREWPMTLHTVKNTSYKM